MLKYKEKQCPVCKGLFKVAANKTSRNFPPSKQVYCSQECARKARYRSGRKCSQLNSLDASYIAGFFDGEGSVMLIKRGSKSHTIGLRVVIAQAERNKYILDWITEVTGVGNSVIKKAQNKFQDNGLTWVCHAEAAEGFLHQLLPFLKIKREQAELGIAFQARLRTPVYKSDIEGQRKEQNTMKSMNKRGKPEFTYQLTCTSGG